MEYIALDSVPYFKECSKVVENEGLKLVELQVVPQKGSVKVDVTVASGDPSKDVSINDVSKAHHALQPVLLSLLNKTEEEVYMEVASPGMERNFKNAAEFEVFTGREIRVWDKTVSDWVRGVIKNSDKNQLTLELEDNSEKSIVLENIAKAKFIH